MYEADKQKLSSPQTFIAVLALVEELHSFQVQVTTEARETFGIHGDGYHDDLVLAIMVAAWAGEHVPVGVLGCAFGPTG